MGLDRSLTRDRTFSDGSALSRCAKVIFSQVFLSIFSLEDNRVEGHFRRFFYPSILP